MVAIPAVCNRCGSSIPSGFNFVNCTNIRMEGNISGSCPKCGGVMEVLNGHFNITDKAIEILFAPQRTIDELRKLDLLIKESKEKNLSPSEIAEKIKSEIPGLSIFANLMPKDRGEWLALAGIIIPLIYGQINQTPQHITQNNIANNITINQSINDGTAQNNNIKTTKDQFLKFKLPNVNDLCYCGSGKKYKKCCKP